MGWKNLADEADPRWTAKGPRLARSGAKDFLPSIVRACNEMARELGRPKDVRRALFRLYYELLAEREVRRNNPNGWEQERSLRCWDTVLKGPSWLA